MTETLTITKRDGHVVPFDSCRIYTAITKAMKETQAGVDEGIAHTITDVITDACIAGRVEPTVEAIQDAVEAHLMTLFPDAAKAYILYRDNRAKERTLNRQLIEKVWAKTDANNIENSNANIDEYSFAGRKNEAANIIQKAIAVEMNMSSDIAAAVKAGFIYEHDLDHYNLGAHNCLQIDFEHVLASGFKARNGDVRSPSSFSTACQQVAVIMQIQSQCQFGGVGSIHIDYDLAPYVKKSFKRHFKDGLKWTEPLGQQLSSDDLKVVLTALDDDICIDDPSIQEVYPSAYAYAMEMLEREGRQAAEALYHNLLTLESRPGGQVPFTSLNMGRDTSTEGRLVTRWLLEASIAGVGEHHLTPIFPITIFCLKRGVNMAKGDPNYDLKLLAIKSMSKRIYPNFVNCDWSEAHEDNNDKDTIFSTMGCRTMIGYDRHGMGYKRVGRGNNVPITIILPKLGIEYGACFGRREESDFDGFWQAFENTLKLTEKALLERFAIMCRQSPKSAAFMYQNGAIADSGEHGTKHRVYEALRHNTLAIGFIGGAELCQAMFGVNHVHSEEARNFLLEVVRRINTFAKEASDRNDLNFSCYATPAEGLCHTALNTLRDQYGVIPNVTDREYLTNSFHVPVWEKVDIYTKLKVEAPFTRLCTGGTITYIECESTFMQNLKAVENVIDYMFSPEVDIPYAAFNFPIDGCNDCGYESEFDDACPECGSENIRQLRRVTGYLSTDARRFNAGKQQEVHDRVKHTAYTSFDQLPINN